MSIEEDPNFQKKLRESLDRIMSDRGKIVEDFCTAYLSELKLLPSEIRLVINNDYGPTGGIYRASMWFEPKIKKESKDEQDNSEESVS